MSKIFDWAKRNWLTLGLAVMVLYMFGKSGLVTPYGVNMMTTSDSFGGVGSVALSAPMMAKTYNPSYPQAAPVATSNRMVVQDTSLSMQVKEVASVLTSIEKTAGDLGGYMVSRSMSKPEGAASGDIIIRVPVEKKEAALVAIKALGVKVVSESVSGYDVTDQYVDIQGRIDGLNKTKAKMEALLAQATKVSDLMEIQLQLDNIQQQIDNYIGQQKYLEQTAKLTRITVSLSTDELALPYAPDAAWRPEVVFKSAVRSMVGSLRSMANGVIWLLVYVPVIVVVIALYWIVKMVWKRFKK